MRLYSKSVLHVLALLLSMSLWAQKDESGPAQISQFAEASLLARLSYSSSIQLPEGKPQICLAVFGDGDYRIVQLTMKGETQRLQGKVSDEQLQQLKALLAVPDFRVLTGSHGGLIRQASESFGAEIRRKESIQRLQWLNPDDGSPFPNSVTKIVDWLKRFEPRQGRPFQQSDFSGVCPSVGLRLLQPSVAANVESSR